MTINFITKGKTDLSQIYVRIKDKTNEIDTTSKTGLSVFNKNFAKGSIALNKTPKNATAELKSELSKHDVLLTEIENKLTSIKRKLLNAYTNRKEYENINAKWVFNIINPQNEKKNKVPNELALYFDYYLNAKKDDLKQSTLKKLKVIANRVKAFEKDTNTSTYLQEVDNNFKQRFKDWSDTKIYHTNTYIKTIKVISTVCKHAKSKHDIVLHPHLFEITKGKEMEYRKSLNIFLDFIELKKIENTNFKIEKLEIARDWLLISCYTAQRVSDFMRFNINDIVEMDESKFLDISQDKTGTPILVYLNDVVLNILEKYNGKFPPLFSIVSKESNELIYNRLIKQVCRQSGITNLVTAQLKNRKTNRIEIKELEKYKFVSSHIGRRSYATNYYGKIDTSLLISATGHKSEKQFLIYVDKAPQQNAKALAMAMRKLSESNNTPFKIIKNASNQN
jgi:hypothetical protein